MIDSKINFINKFLANCKVDSDKKIYKFNPFCFNF